LLAHILLRVLMAATGSPSWLDPTPDWRLIAFSFSLGLAAAVLFGLTPALQVVRRRIRASTLRQVLVAGQVAASCVLLIVSGLLVRGFQHAASGSLGFDYQNVITIQPNLYGHGYSAAQASAYLKSAQERLGGVAGVESVGLTNVLPFGNVTMTTSIEVDGRSTGARMSHIDPQFFPAMKIPLLAGRNFVPGDAHVVIISQWLAGRLWPGGDPLGKQMPMGEELRGSRYTVIGIAGNARMVKMENPDLGEVYFPAGPGEIASAGLVVRTSGAPERLAPVLSGILKDLNPKLIPSVELLPSALRRKLQAAEYGAMAMSVLGMAALALACLGIAGVVAFAVSQRTKEIGIRVALGAPGRSVLSTVLAQFRISVPLGLLAGVGAAAGLSQVLRLVLYGISGLDAMAYAGAIGLFLFSATAAALVPARRALRIDPARALRCD
jgi:predicted permease